MIESGERHSDPHYLFFTSQNLKLDEETRQWTEEGLRELAGGNVHIPPAMSVVPSKKRVRGPDTSENGSESPLSKKSKPSSSQPVNSIKQTAASTAAEHSTKTHVEIPENAEIIVISDSTNDGNTPVKATAKKQHNQRRRLYHPESHTSTCWRCPVDTCRRHDPDFGFQDGTLVERHIKNRHGDGFVYLCISGCTISFKDGRAWEKHHWEFHGDELLASDI